jgi:predicted RNA-binding protein with RPS1 domain
MTRTIEIKINKTVFKFIETIYEEEGLLFIKSIQVDKSNKIKLIIRGRDHNPPHIHIHYNYDDFRFKLKIQDFYIKDIKDNREFEKLKNDKNLYRALLKYLEKQQDDLINSFYILNPTLIS